MNDIVIRAELIHLQTQRLRDEGERCAANGDLPRLKAVQAEMALLLANMRDLREEQLVANLSPPAGPTSPKRPWWRRFA